MKRILSALILIAMLLSITVCNSKQPVQPAGPITPDVSTTQTVETDEPTETRATITPISHDESEQIQLDNIIVIRETDNSFISSEVDPASVLKIRQLSNSDCLFIDSRDNTTTALCRPNGYAIYFYEANESGATPWWEKQEIPEGMQFTETKKGEYTTNFYPDLPDGLLQSIRDDEPLYTYRNGRLYLLYSDAIYAYQQGAKKAEWLLDLHEGCFITTFDNRLRVYDGADQLFKLDDDGNVNVALDHITDAVKDYFYDSVLDALVIKDGVLNLYCITSYREHSLIGVIAEDVTDAKFVCDTILFTKDDGYTYAFDGDEYYDALNDPLNQAQGPWENIQLGTESIDFYAAAYLDYIQRDDLVGNTHAEIRHNFLISFTN